MLISRASQPRGQPYFPGAAVFVLIPFHCPITGINAMKQGAFYSSSPVPFFHQKSASLLLFLSITTQP
jgi:hypothetical protein